MVCISLSPDCIRKSRSTVLGNSPVLLIKAIWSNPPGGRYLELVEATVQGQVDVEYLPEQDGFVEVKVNGVAGHAEGIVVIALVSVPEGALEGGDVAVRAGVAVLAIAEGGGEITVSLASVIPGAADLPSVGKGAVRADQLHVDFFQGVGTSNGEGEFV